MIFRYSALNSFYSVIFSAIDVLILALAVIGLITVIRFFAGKKKK
jgi:hypothetical protein